MSEYIIFVLNIRAHQIYTHREIICEAMCMLIRLLHHSKSAYFIFRMLTL